MSHPTAGLKYIHIHRFPGPCFQLLFAHFPGFPNRMAKRRSLMSSRTSRAFILRVALYGGAIVLILALWQVQRAISQNFFEPAIADASFVDESQLNALLDQNSLLTTLCTGLLGALGFFLIRGRNARRWTGAMWFAFASAGCAVLSLLFGYMVYLALLDMLRNQMFDLAMPAMWVRYAQFYCFLLAVMLFGDFAFQTINAEDGNEREHHAASD
jgi:hypothetical protein